jgi:hypothetical protein
MTDLDAILAELGDLRTALDGLAPEHPHRIDLEKRREVLHARARRQADLIRPTPELRRELDTAKKRLAELDSMRIKPSFTERRQERWPIGDPTGYIHKINSTIEEGTADERTDLVERIAEISAMLDDR